MARLLQNLDVNLAVNNLLSRDDEGDEDEDSQDGYMPGGFLRRLLILRIYINQSLLSMISVI